MPVLSEAISLTGTRLNTLDIPLHLTRPELTEVARIVPPFMFASLTQLRLLLYVEGHQDPSQDWSPGLAQLLAMAPQLSELHLQCLFNPPPVALVRLTNITPLSRLSYLELTAMRTSEGGLMHFIEAHAATLSRLCLRNILLDGGEWDSVLLRLHSLHSLRQLTLAWLYKPFGLRKAERTGPTEKAVEALKRAGVEVISGLEYK